MERMLQPRGTAPHLPCIYIDQDYIFPEGLRLLLSYGVYTFTRTTSSLRACAHYSHMECIHLPGLHLS